MIVCTTEDATTKNCCMMVKKCCGEQCMAWSELGYRGFCGVLMQQGIKDRVEVVVTGMVQSNAVLTPESPDTLTVTSVQTGIIPENAVIDGLPRYVSQESLQSANSAQTLHKPNKHKGNK